MNYLLPEEGAEWNGSDGLPAMNCRLVECLFVFLFFYFFSITNSHTRTTYSPLSRHQLERCRWNLEGGGEMVRSERGWVGVILREDEVPNVL